MIKDKIILTDCDGVLLNWEKAFDKYMSEMGHNQLPATDYSYSISVRYNITDEYAHHCITCFNNSVNIASLSPFADSVKYVKQLSQHGFKFVVITSLSALPAAKQYRVQNLIAIFGDVFTDIVCLPTGQDKYTELSKWKDSGYFWIEDHITNANSGHSLRLKSVLINHSYNRAYTDLQFNVVSDISPWSAIYLLICNEYGIHI